MPHFCKVTFESAFAKASVFAKASPDKSQDRSYGGQDWVCFGFVLGLYWVCFGFVLGLIGFELALYWVCFYWHSS